MVVLNSAHFPQGYIATKPQFVECRKVMGSHLDAMPDPRVAQIIPHDLYPYNHDSLTHPPYALHVPMVNIAEHTPWSLRLCTGHSASSSWSMTACLLPPSTTEHMGRLAVTEFPISMLTQWREDFEDHDTSVGGTGIDIQSMGMWWAVNVMVQIIWLVRALPIYLTSLGSWASR